MDELKLNLSSRFMKGIATKMIAKTIKKKLGYQIDIQLQELTVEAVGGKVYIHVNADAEMNNSDFAKLVKCSDED